MTITIDTVIGPIALEQLRSLGITEQQFTENIKSLFSTSSKFAKK